MRFKDLELRRHYNSDEDDVLACFYRPVVASALRYDRAVGYFSSTTFRACGAELASFLGRQGQIRLVIGCLVDPADIRELEGKGLSGSDAEREALRREIKEQLERSIEGDVDSSVLFAKLVVSGAAQVKFAVRKRGIYHEKFGVFADADGERIAFIGSVNETSAALTFGANHESFSVYRSSEPHIYDAYGTDLESRFERLWTGDTVATTIYELGDDSLSLMRQLASRASADHATPTAVLPKLEPRFQLRPYQHEAMKSGREQIPRHLRHGDGHREDFDRDRCGKAVSGKSIRRGGCDYGAVPKLGSAMDGSPPGPRARGHRRVRKLWSLVSASREFVPCIPDNGYGRNALLGMCQ